MAKSMKKPTKSPTPKKPVKPKVVAKAKPAPKGKAAAKTAAKPAVKPKVVAKPKVAAKPKLAAKPAAKPAKKTTAVKSSKTTKPKVAAKPAKSIGAKPVKKATKPKTGPSQLARGSGTAPSIISLPASPNITAPLAGATVGAGVNLPVSATTNRDDLGYVFELTDVTPPGPAPVPVPFAVASPAGSPFAQTIPGSNLAAGRTYEIRVSVHPAATGHADHVITINT